MILPEDIYGFEISHETVSQITDCVLDKLDDWQKDILGLWLNESESKHTWMQIFDELKTRGVEDVLFICMDGVTGLEDGAKVIFKDVVVQRCIVRLIRNSIKYVPSKDYKNSHNRLKKFTEHQALMDAEKHLNSFVRSGHNTPEQLMCGNEISTMSSSFSITEVPFVRLCTQPMRLKA